MSTRSKRKSFTSQIIIIIIFFLSGLFLLSSYRKGVSLEDAATVPMSKNEMAIVKYGGDVLHGIVEIRHHLGGLLLTDMNGRKYYLYKNVVVEMIPKTKKLIDKEN